MARKWFNFQCFMESFLRKIYSRIQRFIYQWKLYHRLLILLLLGIFIAVGMPFALSQVSINNPGFKQISTAQQLMEDARNYYNQLHYDKAEEKLEQAVNILKLRKDQQVNYAIALSDLALIYQKLENLEDALKNWEETETIYRSLSKKSKNQYQYQLTNSQIHQVQALQLLGNFQAAKEKIEKIENIPRDIQSKVLRTFGDLLRAIGDLTGSETKLIASFREAKTSEDKNATSLSLGNTVVVNM